MDYEKLCASLLDEMFSSSIFDNETDHPASSHLSALERERLRWGFWAPSYMICISAQGKRCSLHGLDNERLTSLIEDTYRERLPRDDTRITVGTYIRNRDELKALKSSRAVPCSFFSRIEDQVVTRGTLAAALASHRLYTLSAAFLEGYQASSQLERFRQDMGAPSDMMMDSLADSFGKGASTRIKDGILRGAMVYAGLILDSGEFHQNEKSLEVMTMLSELIEWRYVLFCRLISEHANVDA